MKDLLKVLDKYNNIDPTYDDLGDTLVNVDFDSLDYKDLIPEIEESNNYARNILTLRPIECVIIHWPPGVESAIHHHKGFWGYVAVLEGRLNNIEYKHEGDTLKESANIIGLVGGLLAEREGVIHKLVNPDQEKTAVTAHFYYPALESFEGMKIYDTEHCRIGILGPNAKTASWEEDPDNFNEIIENAFEYKSFEDYKSVSHRIIPVVPKPDRDTIADMISDYYEEQAKEYDSFDLKHESRKAYTERINKYIADHVKHNYTKDMLVVACGTGRRAIHIKELSGKDYNITGVDISQEMCDIASKRGINAICSHWLDAELEEDKFDIATFLYAFGHVTTEEERIKSLQKVCDALRPGGTLFMDVFNVNDKNEWGPRALKTFEDLHLYEYGYDKGDVFYKKVGGDEVAFLHYFDEIGLIAMLEKTGFKVDDLKHIGYVTKAGGVINAKDEGALFVKAVKI